MKKEGERKKEEKGKKGKKREKRGNIEKGISNQQMEKCPKEVPKKKNLYL